MVSVFSLSILLTHKRLIFPSWVVVFFLVNHYEPYSSILLMLQFAFSDLYLSDSTEMRKWLNFNLHIASYGWKESGCVFLGFRWSADYQHCVLRSALPYIDCCLKTVVFFSPFRNCFFVSAAMGRKKISIQKIDDDRNRQVSNVCRKMFFSKAFCNNLVIHPKFVYCESPKVNFEIKKKTRMLS